MPELSMFKKLCQEIRDKETWENFLLGCKEKTFLQSWNWGEFQARMGNKIWRLGIYDEKGNLISVALVIKVAAKRGTFLLIQHGPVIKTFQFQKQILEILLEKLKEIAVKESCDFVRITPLFEENKQNQNLFEDLGFRVAPMHASAYSATLKLDLSLPEQDLLIRMRKTTRYLIRQALKNSDFSIQISNRLEDVKIFDRLNKQVARHQKFVPFSFRFVKNEFEVFSKKGQALLFLGKYEGETIASALVIFWSGIGFYHQAALDPKWHKLPVAYLLQWEAIKEAKRRGCNLYDFWGFVDPWKNPDHPWAGPSLFKLGFGGKVYQYIKTQDFPLSKKYWLTFIFEKFRKKKRRL